MFEVYKFPADFYPFWHLGARMGVGSFRRALNKMPFDMNALVSRLETQNELAPATLRLDGFAVLSFLDSFVPNPLLTIFGFGHII